MISVGFLSDRDDLFFDVIAGERERSERQKHEEFPFREVQEVWSREERRGEQERKREERRRGEGTRARIQRGKGDLD